MKHIEKAKSLVFVIDSSDKQSFKAAAQQLVDLLMNKNVVDNCPAVLFLVNKSDLLESRNPELVMHFVQLETERILKAYKSESHMKKISPESMELLNRLAQEEFSMDKIPLSFKWCSGSVKTGELSHVHSFIEAIG
ncbi:hypothetical protein BgAZ_101040 [Babesia gibsoni]|uniref:Signal recognition particle receptor subunit beta n=1 Tax=Babesia gibsoni TaxID=33632 RepID=A0AAD8PF52_BABGI|nr:hypothetical protein BgAZ_101040 [Babesia gibsoni]